MNGIGALIRFVSLRHIATSPLRSLLTLLGVALGVAMLVGMTAANSAVLDAFKEMVDRASGKADLEVAGDEAGVDQALVDELSSHTDLVAHVAGRIEQTSFLLGDDGNPGERVLVLGIDFLGDKEFLPFETESGSDVLTDPLAFLNDPNAILVSDTLAKAHGLKPGSTLKLRTAEGMTEFHVESILKDTGKSHAFGGQLVLLFLDAAQLAFDRRGSVDRIDIALAPKVTGAAAKAPLQTIIGTRGKVQSPQARGAQVASMTTSFRLGLEAQGMLAMLVGMFLIYNAVSVSVAQRRREIGILRSIGVTRRKVAVVFLAEAVVLGALGGVLGVLLGGVLARFVILQFAPTVSRFYENIPTPKTDVPPILAAVGILSGMIATVIAAWLPARRASQTSPIETLRRDLHASAQRRPNVRVLLAVGVACGAAAFAVTAVDVPYIGFASILLILAAAAFATPTAVVFLAPIFAVLAQRTLGLSARLGVDNVSRELGRSALTISALVLATAMSVTVACYSYSYEASCMAWVEQSIPADIVVTAGSPVIDRNAVPFAASLRETLVGIPGIQDLDSARSLTVPLGEHNVEILSLDTPIYLARPVQIVLSGPSPIPPDALSKEPAVLVSENYADRNHLSVGQSVTLPSPTGAHDFKIVAIVVDYSSDQGWMLLDRRYMKEFWRDDRVESLDIYLLPGFDSDKVAAAIRTRLAASGGEAQGMFVTTNASLKKEVRHIIQQTFELGKASEGIALLVAVLGVIGTMLAAVIDRIREIGVLRAIGATRRQILFAVMAEAAFLGVCAAVVGVIAAVPASILFVKTIGVQATGWSVPFRFPALAVARAVLSVIFFSMASGFLPGWKAARLQITHALAYE